MVCLWAFTAGVKPFLFLSIETHFSVARLTPYHGKKIADQEFIEHRFWDVTSLIMVILTKTYCFYEEN
jgi:hypothetical protein